MNRRALLLGLLGIAACGKPPAPAAHGETAEYQEWRGQQVFRRMSGPSPEPGRIDLHLPASRSASPADFCELFVNGSFVGRFKISEGTAHSARVTFNSGPLNSFDLWDSTTNRYYRLPVDTREAVDFDCVPDAGGYELRPRKREER
jgi:hypothetical protein